MFAKQHLNHKHQTCEDAIRSVGVSKCISVMFFFLLFFSEPFPFISTNKNIKLCNTNLNTKINQIALNSATKTNVIWCTNSLSKFI